jgi:hypothetical protein
MKTAQTIAQNTEGRSVSAPKAKKPGHRHPNSLANLVAPWKPGQTGNPNGRPKDVAGELSRAAFENNKQEIYKAIVEKLLAGDAYAFSVHSDRGYGKLKQGFIHTGDEGGGPVKASITVNFVTPDAK